MAKRKKPARKSKKTIDRAVYEKLETILLKAQDMAISEQSAECLALCNTVIKHRKATKQQKSEAYQFRANAFMQTQDFSLASKAFTAAIGYKPNDWKIYYNRSISMFYTTHFAQSLKDIEQAAALCNNAEWQEMIAEKRCSTEEIVRAECLTRGPDFTVDDLAKQQALFQEGLTALYGDVYDEAETKLKQSIAMGDVLPQPWFNLGSVYMLREEWDSAEKAWRRALEIDPDYAKAHNNLAKLPAMRAGETFTQIKEYDPFKGKINNLGVRYISDEQ